MRKDRVNPTEAQKYGQAGTAEETSAVTYFPSTIFQGNDISEIREHLAGLAKERARWEYPVDEHRTMTLAPDQETTVRLLPNYEFPIFLRTIIVTGPPTGTSTTTVDGNVTNPGVNGTIVNLGVLPKGNYVANVTLELQGTVTAADANNMKFVASGGAVIPAFEYPGVAGVYPQPTFIFSADGINPVTVNAVAAASGVSAIYAANVTVSPIPPTFTLQLGDRVWNLALPASGILPISVDSLTLDRNDYRTLTSTTPGEWGLELIGWGDVRKRRI